MAFALIAILSDAQERIQSISAGITLLGQPYNRNENYLSNKGFQFSSNYKNIFTYSKSTEVGNYEFTIAYKNKKADVVSWLEHIRYLSSITNELRMLDFKSISGNTYNSIYGFKNVSKNLTVTIIIRGETNDLNITIGVLNPSKPLQAMSNDLGILERKDNVFKKPNQGINVIDSNKFFSDYTSKQLNTQLLPNPRTIFKGKQRKFLTSLNKAQILAYYKPFGASSIFGDAFHLPILEDKSDACILVQITRQGNKNQLEFSNECD